MKSDGAEKGHRLENTASRGRENSWSSWAWGIAVWESYSVAEEMKLLGFAAQNAAQKKGEQIRVCCTKEREADDGIGVCRGVQRAGLGFAEDGIRVC